MIQFFPSLFAQKKERLLLDEFPNAAAAYSLRLLSSSYTGNCIEVRRSSDNALQNIGFVDGVLDTGSLLSFVEAGDGFVRTWYDQSGNANNSVSTTNDFQPKIISIGSLNLLNGKPSLLFDGVDDRMSAMQVGLTEDSAMMAVWSRNINAFSFIFGQGTSLGADSNTSQQYTFATNSVNNFAVESKRQEFGKLSIIRAIINATPIITVSSSTKNGLLKLITNGIESETFERTTNFENFTTPLAIGRSIVRNNFTLNGNIQEAIMYNSNQESNLIEINNNVNNYYNIY